MRYERRIQILRWALWTLLLIGSLVLQATVFPLWAPVIPLLVPVTVACIATMGSAESGAVFGLVGGLLGYLGGDAMSFTIPVLTFVGAMTGTLCSRWFTRTLLPALLCSFAALLLCELPAWALRVYRDIVPLRSFLTVLLPELGCSLICALPLYLLSWRISLLGQR